MFYSENELTFWISAACKLSRSFLQLILVDIGWPKITLFLVEVKGNRRVLHFLKINEFYVTWIGSWGSFKIYLPSIFMPSVVELTILLP